MYGNGGYGKQQGRGGARPPPVNYGPPGNFGQVPVAEMQFDVSQVQIPPRTIDFSVEEGKAGKIGKVTISENPRQDANPKAPKFQGELKFGDYVFEISLWANKKKDGEGIYYSGPVKRKRGY